MSDETMTFAELLKKKRKDVRMTQDELAKRIGTSSASVRRYEAGDSLPNQGTLGLICIALNDNSLINAWSTTEAQNRSEKKADNTAGLRIRKADYFVQAMATIREQRWTNLVQQASREMKDNLVNISQYFQHMSQSGIDLVLAVAEGLSKNPDYQCENPRKTRREYQRKKKADSESDIKDK